MAGVFPEDRSSPLRTGQSTGATLMRADARYAYEGPKRSGWATMPPMPHPDRTIRVAPSVVATPKSFDLPRPRRAFTAPTALLLGLIGLCGSLGVATGCVSAKTKGAEPAATCAKAGDTCTFSPGKLGLCVEPADGQSALVCQSLH
jgi:hypothetical protein